MDKFPNDWLEALVIVSALVLMSACGFFLWYLGTAS